MVSGDTLGLQLDLNRRTLTAAINGKVLGVMVKDDEAFVPLLRWCVQLEGSRNTTRDDGGSITAVPPAVRIQATPI